MTIASKARTYFELPGIISRVVVGRGDARRVAALIPGKDAQRLAATQIKRFLFPSDGAYHKARRRGERALAGLPPRVRALSI